MVSVLVPLASRPQCLIRSNPLGRTLHQEPPDELVRLERHGLVTAGSLDPVARAKKLRELNKCVVEFHSQCRP